jgi:hypothetical protein
MGGGKVMDANITSTEDIAIVASPNAVINLIPMISPMMSQLVLGSSIMREDFITSTRLLQDAKPVNQP